MTVRLHTYGFLLATVVLTLGPLIESSSAQPIFSNSYRLPRRGVSVASGLYVEVTPDRLQSANFGYRSIDFQLYSPKPLTADTSITIRVFVFDWNGHQHDMSAEADVEMTIGQSTATATVRLPQYIDWDYLSWDVWVDGEHDPKLSQTNEPPVQFLGGQPGNNQDEELFHVWDANPKQFGLLGRMQLQLGFRRNRQSTMALHKLQQPLSNHWLDYTPSDAVAIDVEVLSAMTTVNPEGIAALRQWVRAGGNLWVQNVGTNWDKLEKIHAALDLPAADSATPVKQEGIAPPAENNWSFVRLNYRLPTPQADGLVQDFGIELGTEMATEMGTDRPPAVGSMPEVEPIYSDDWFVVRRLGWGTIGAYRLSWGDAPRELNQQHKEAAVAFWHRRAWPLRHGLVPNEANGDFSNWLIPGVGMAPVVEFQVLITLFVLAIGPLNYWLLKRAGRLHLLVLTVPIAASLITGALLTYGLLADGFGTRVRSLSITLLDQKRGEAVSWSRLSYYAAFAPRDGLTFSADTTIYPIRPGYDEGYANPSARQPKDIVWTDNEQRLTSGWLASRTPTQYLTIEPKTTDAKVDFHRNGDRLTATNSIGAGAELLLVIDADGKWHEGTSIAEGESTKLTPIATTEAVTLLRKFLGEREPRVPSAIEAADDSSMLRAQRRQARRQSYDYSGPTADDGLLHQRWQELLGFAGGEPLILPPRSYRLVSNTAAIAETGLDSAREEASVHIVIGSW